MTARLASCLTAATLLIAAPLAAQSETVDSLAFGRQYSSWFAEGHADSLWSVMDEGMRGRVGSIESIEGMMDRVFEQIGDETEVISESARLTDDGVLEYRRLSEFDAAPERIVLVWGINSEGELTRAEIRPESEALPAN